MHSFATAKETLKILWNNYLTLSGEVDIEAMSPETLEYHIEQKSPRRPKRIAAWLARHGTFIAIWALWEYYSCHMCAELGKKAKKIKKESTVDWIAKSLAENNIDFKDKEWFSSANCLRNLIVHSGARAIGSRPEKLLDRSKKAFPDLVTWLDGYVAIEDTHLAELMLKVEDFIFTTLEPQAAIVSPNELLGDET